MLDYEYDPTETDTILVLAVKEVMDKSWYSACLEIRSACFDAGLKSLNVEISDERGLRPTVCHHISAHELFAMQWYPVRSRVIDLLGHERWLSISLFRRGTREDFSEFPVIIVITIPVDSDPLWSVARDNMAAMSDSEGCYNVAMEIKCGRIWRGKAADQNRCLLKPERDWKVAAQMERNVGRRDTLKNSATLSGFLELRSSDTGEWKRYGVTCFHCVLSPAETQHLIVRNLKRMVFETEPTALKWTSQVVVTIKNLKILPR
jgi:hypothetical protein